MGSNEWFEYDLAEDGGQTGTTESLPVSGVQTIMGLQNSGAKIVHRSVLLCLFAAAVLVGVCCLAVVSVDLSLIHI